MRSCRAHLIISGIAVSCVSNDTDDVDGGYHAYDLGISKCLDPDKVKLFSYFLQHAVNVWVEYRLHVFPVRKVNIG